MTNVPEALVLTPRFPLPLTSGTQIREYHVLRALAERFNVTLVTLVQNGEGTEYVEDIAKMATVHTVPHTRSKSGALVRFAFSRQPYRVCKFTTPSFKQQTQKTLSHSSFDLVWANFLNTVPAISDNVECPVILDEHNSDVNYWESFLDGGIPERTMARLNIRRIHRLQKTIADRIDGVVSVSEADAAEARKWVDDPVWSIPNGVDINKFSPSMSAADAGKRVVFVGSLDVHMNVEAVEWFVETAWPKIRESHSDATFAVVGRNPTDRIQEVANTPGIKIAGEVPSVVPQYNQAAISVAPFQFGGGTKLKILETLAMGRPLVTTPVGMTGIPLTDGKEALVRERGSAFAEAVVDLLASPKKRLAIGKQAQTFVQREFAWENLIEAGLNRIVSEVL